MIDYLKNPMAMFSAVGGSLAALLHLDVFAVLIQWGWFNVDQLFYMGTLLMNSAPVLPVGEDTVAKFVAVAGMLLLLKVALKAREQIDNQINETEDT